MFGLHPDRIREIAEAPAFQCHKTVAYGSDDEAGDNPQQCAGLMAMLHAEGRPNQIMQVGERLGVFDPTQLKTDEAFDSVDAAIAAHTALYRKGDRT